MAYTNYQIDPNYYSANYINNPTTAIPNIYPTPSTEPTDLTNRNEQQGGWSHSDSLAENSSTLSNDVIASQERAMALAKQRASQRTAVTTSTVSFQTSTNLPRHLPAQEQSLTMVQYTPTMTPSSSITDGPVVHPRKKQMKQVRKVKTATGVVGGAVVGTVILGPVGTVLGGAVGGVATNRICKAGERRAQRKFEQSNFQAAAASRAGIGSFC